MEKIAISRTTLILLIGFILIGSGVVGAWMWIFRATDNAEFNKLLRGVGAGESRSLTDMVGVDALRVCWLQPAYEYHSLPNPADYVSGMLGAELDVFPGDLGTSEGGYAHLFISYPDNNVRTVKLVSGWVGTDEARNWCAPVEKVRVQKTDEGWRAVTEEPSYYKLPR